MISTLFQTTEAQSSRPRTPSVISVPLCFKSSRPEIAEHGYVLTPGRYVGVEDDRIPLADKMETLTAELADQLAESAKLEEAIRRNMKPLGFELPKAGAK